MRVKGAHATAVEGRRLDSASKGSSGGKSSKGSKRYRGMDGATTSRPQADQSIHPLGSTPSDSPRGTPGAEAEVHVVYIEDVMVSFRRTLEAAVAALGVDTTAHPFPVESVEALALVDSWRFYLGNHLRPQLPR